MIDCITLETRRGALKDACHPAMEPNLWHQLTLLMAGGLRVVDEVYNELALAGVMTGNMTPVTCVLPSTESVPDLLAKYTDSGGCGAIDQQWNRLHYSLVTDLNAGSCLVSACY